MDKAPLFSGPIRASHDTGEHHAGQDTDTKKRCWLTLRELRNRVEQFADIAISDIGRDTLPTFSRAAHHACELRGLLFDTVRGLLDGVRNVGNRVCSSGLVRLNRFFE